MPPQTTHTIGRPRSDQGIAPYANPFALANKRVGRDALISPRNTDLVGGHVGRHPLMPPQTTHTIGRPRSDQGRR